MLSGWLANMIEMFWSAWVPFPWKHEVMMNDAIHNVRSGPSHHRNGLTSQFLVFLINQPLLLYCPWTALRGNHVVFVADVLLFPERGSSRDRLQLGPAGGPPGPEPGLAKAGAGRAEHHQVGEPPHGRERTRCCSGQHAQQRHVL